MFLKKFELHGFKSFADKTALEFNDGISTIVGPNGSGKSNISDAMMWVMGEQRIKTLRGARVEDVIFSGSDTHKPLGMAAVSITMDNQEGILSLPYEEVTITRKAYRSGESEFYINKNSCRLKDIQMLFHDTGIGRDSFAMIGQGRVDEIITAKPEDRRAMIEELAGIVKYRNRKNEAQRKIANTEQNLLRVMDIISELSVNLEPLGEEAEKAQNYLDIKDELDDLDINILVRDIERGNEIRLEMDTQIQLLEMETSELESNIAMEEATFETERLNMDKLNEDMSLRQGKLYELRNSAGHLHSQLELSETMLQNLQLRRSKIEEEMQWQNHKMESLHAVHQEKIEKHDWLVKALEAKTIAIDELTNSITFLSQRKDQKAMEMEHLNAQFLDEMQFLASLHNEYNKVLYAKEATLTQEDKSKEEALKISQRVEGLRKEMEIVTQSVMELEQRVQSTSQEQEEIKNIYQIQSKDALVMQESLAQQEKELQTALSKKKVLEDIQNEHEGYFYGVKTVLKAKKESVSGFEGVRGVIADLIDIDKEYVKAIEIGLGNSIQDLVVSDQKAAQHAIAHLKRVKGGRATFLPLDTIVPRPLHERNMAVLELEGILGTASSLIRFEPFVRPAIEHLLGSVLVAKDLDWAVKASKIANQGLKIVTLEGDVIHPGGSISGGQIEQKGSSILVRKVEIQELEKQINRLTASKSAANRDFAELAQKMEVNAQKISQINQQMKAEEDQLLSKSQEKEYLQKLLLAQEESLEIFSMDQQEISRQRRDILDNESMLKKKMHGAEKHKIELEETLKASDLEYTEVVSTLENKRQELQELHLERVSLQEKESALKDALSVYYGQSEEIYERLTNLDSELKKILDESSEHDEKILKINAQIEDMGNVIEELTFSIQDQKVKKDLLADSINQKATGSKEMRKQLSEKSKLLNGHLVTMAKQETDLENKHRRLEEKHDIAFAEALIRKRDIDDLKIAEKRLKDLKREMAFLGTVNIAAIDEYARVKERFDFLMMQEMDLRNSIEKLDQVIAEIDGVMVERFKKSFQEIAEAFKESFSKLFDGGEASLFLTEPEDLLNTGVDIEAKPPGKGLKHMNLLSGGEKALTAIALLFAFLKIKPSPFCVLDEIDAALDEVNVNHFSNYLREFAKHTQFVVISHRQGTIENSDSLFGVTMDKKSGITKMVSVRLQDPNQAVAMRS